MRAFCLYAGGDKQRANHGPGGGAFGFASAEAGACAPAGRHRTRDAAGAETTDFIVPYGVLREANVADVRTVSTQPGPLQLMMQLRVQPDETTAQFDARAPEGADIVIVPAQMARRSPALSTWLRRQAEHGATIVSICEGARVLAYAGLLRGRRATSHFSALRELERAYPRPPGCAIAVTCRMAA